MPNLAVDSTAPDNTNADEFVAHYERESLTPATAARCRETQGSILRTLPPSKQGKTLDIVDIGCGPGSHSLLWAQAGHRVRGLDVSQRLIDLARRRAADRHLDITFVVGTAISLPWEDRSADVCILPELLEHVADWRTCLHEAARVVRPDGVLYLSTTNYLCPVQQEFDLPLYSWYPGPLKRRFERLAVSSRPELVNHATYPAVNWFSFYSLQRELAALGFRSLDRFQTASLEGGRAKRACLQVLRRSAALRLLAQFATPYTQVIAIRVAQ
jgi:2-polyprenyl-6-hydroxyphenyl methylase/3-demethylubiquinone-9 3-methyltransferase